MNNASPFKFNIGQRVVVDTKNQVFVGTITNREIVDYSDYPMYTLTSDGTFGYIMMLEDCLSLPIGSQKKCECGSSTTYGYTDMHSDWCPVWVPKGAY